MALPSGSIFLSMVSIYASHQIYFHLKGCSFHLCNFDMGHFVSYHGYAFLYLLEHADRDITFFTVLVNQLSLLTSLLIAFSSYYGSYFPASLYVWCFHWMPDILSFALVDVGILCAY